MLTRRSMILAGTAGLASSALPAAAPESTGAWGGTWTGVLELGSTRLRVRFEIGVDDAVNFYSVDQDNQPIAGRASHDGDRIRVELAAIGGVFTGTRTTPGRIDGEWKQNVRVPLVLLAGEKGYDLPIEPLTQPGLIDLLRRSGAPALAAVAQRRGAPARVWAAGRRSIGTSARVTPADVWHLGSITKSMTATLVARLVEAGQICWELDVATALGDIAPDMKPAYRAVTLRHLLSHRAGLPADISAPQLAAFALTDFAEIRGQRRRYARLALGMEPAGPPQTNYLYSNNGYVVAGAMLESLFGTSWEELMRAYVFSPLGLRSAGFGPPDAGSFGPLRQPVGHAADLDAKLLALFGSRGLRPVRPGLGEAADNPRVLGPAATVHMNLADLNTYLAAHRDANSFLSGSSWSELHTPPFGGDYALGWMVRADGTRWHNGSNTFWYAEVQFQRGRGVSAAAVCNEARTPATFAVGSALLRAAAAVY